MQPLHRVSGFTLPELILTIAIVTIVTALAAPPIADLFLRYQHETLGRELFELIAFSRGKAYGHGRVYTLCPSADGESCTSDWSQGAMLFADNNGNGEHEIGENIERVMQKLADGASLEWRSFGNKKYLQFRPSGLTPFQSGNFSYCPPDGNAEYGWIIVLNVTGRPYFGRDSDGDGIAENGSGDNLSCTTNI
ncbi:GspH/FimT family pseudopilin [Microbulbifer marinus]|uniref:Type II secretion system protein H n=1 Tax=Microbulbifer marinus TaxID=658218 RepID=A0A1H4BI91_9GAMM|nr:GspH/FimT family pseudopilin [Microbulbifer marinus]SEA47826.1 type IV fimbrial biogenesis protein FimT [Microbulbifer marinus]